MFIELMPIDKMDLHQKYQAELFTILYIYIYAFCSLADGQNT